MVLLAESAFVVVRLLKCTDIVVVVALSAVGQSEYDCMLLIYCCINFFGDEFEPRRQVAIQVISHNMALSRNNIQKWH